MAGHDFLLISCEHGGNVIPPAYRPLFRAHSALLASHRGHDPGALTLARELAAELRAPLFQSTVSRLLIDLNRSARHPRLYSEITRDLPDAVRKDILERHYLPYRSKVEAAVADAAGRGLRVVHIASHSFTPVLDGEIRNADVGLLYDPGRPGESALCRAWQAALAELAPGIRVRRNYPYRGTSDGFAAYLRRRFSDSAYVGVELEVNQCQVARGGEDWHRLRRLLIAALRRALAATQSQPRSANDKA